MSDTIRESIIQELVDLIEAYTFTAVSSPGVYRGRQVFDPDTEPPPIITVLPRSEENQNTDYGMHDLTMPVDIICLERMVDQNPSELGEAILGELIRCVFGYEAAGPTKVGGMSATYADEVVYRSGGIDAYPDELGQQILHVGITIDIRYQTNAGDPYSNS